MLKSRKKILLSSIAMLLVALIALGSATFAWYITNATVHANEATFSASAADGLVIRTHHGTTAGDWNDDHIDLNDKASLKPASYNYGSWGSLVGGAGQGTAFDNGALNNDGLTTVYTNADIIDETASNESFLVDKFDVASTSTAKPAKARMRVTSLPSEASYLVIAVYYEDTLQAVFTTSSDDEPTKTNKVKSSGASSVETDTATQTLTQITATGSYNLPDIQANTKALGGQQIRIIAFADGYDGNCKNSTANPNGLTVTFDFTTNASF